MDEARLLRLKCPSLSSSCTVKRVQFVELGYLVCPEETSVMSGKKSKVIRANGGLLLQRKAPLENCLILERCACRDSVPLTLTKGDLKLERRKKIHHLLWNAFFFFSGGKFSSSDGYAAFCKNFFQGIIH